MTIDDLAIKIDKIDNKIYILDQKIDNKTDILDKK